MWSRGRSGQYVDLNIIGQHQRASLLKGVKQVGVNLIEHANTNKLCIPNQQIEETLLNNI